MDEEMCTSWVSRGDVWHFQDEPCGNKAKGTLANGDPACGTHLRSERLEIERANKSADLTTRIAAVNDALGIGAAQCWNKDGMAVVAIAELEALVTRSLEAPPHG